MPSDRELVERCLAGETEAFHGLVERHRDRLYRVAYRYLRHREDAREVCQEAFTRAFERLGTYDPARSFGTWLFAVAANLARDILRRRGRRATVVADERVRLVPGGEAPDAVAAGREEAERLRRAVDGLDPEKRLAVLLRYYEGLSIAEIARITGHAPGTVKVRLFRARKELLGRLEER